jgi:hypothetical protein
MRLLEAASAETPAAESHYLDLVAKRTTQGSLSNLIRKAVGPRGGLSRMRGVYGELADALDCNEPWAL